MGMWTTEHQDNFAIVLRAFSEAARKNYGSHDFEAGYLQSMAVQMMGFMPKKAQKIFVEDMVRATKKQEAQYAKKMNENQTFEKV